MLASSIPYGNETTKAEGNILAVMERAMKRGCLECFSVSELTIKLSVSCVV